MHFVLPKSRSQERKDERQKKIVDLLEAKQAYSSSSGLTVEEIADPLKQSEATIRNDTNSMKEMVGIDDSRKPWKYYLRRKRSP